ncbi:MAG: hypothetical protein ACM30E_03270 [Nitrososphaerales archaeon]
MAVLAFAAGACGDNRTPAVTPVTDVSGTWVSSTSTYPNAPFQLVLTQTGQELSGSYSDRVDVSTSLSGGYLRIGPGGSMNMQINLANGEKLHLHGTVFGPNTIKGDMEVLVFQEVLGVLQSGGTLYSYTMTR